jgi:hypothetical protein
VALRQQQQQQQQQLQQEAQQVKAGSKAQATYLEPCDSSYCKHLLLTAPGKF